MALPFPIEHLLPIAWSKGQVVQVAHFRHNDYRTAALARLHSLARPGAFGVIAHDVPTGREAQLVELESEISMRDADVRVMFSQNFVAQTPAGDSLVVLRSANGKEGVTEVTVEAGGGRNRAIWSDTYYLVIGRSGSTKAEVDTAQLSHPEFGEGVKLAYDPVEVTIEDATQTSRRAPDPDRLPIARLRKRDRAFDVDITWAPAALSMDVALGVSTVAWDALRGALRDVIGHFGALRPDNVVGPAMLARVGGHQSLVRELRSVMFAMERPETLRIEDLAEQVWEALREWESRTDSARGARSRLDDELFRDVLANRGTSDILSMLDSALRALPEAVV